MVLTTSEPISSLHYWRPKLKWFAAEFLVVVTGILVAVALNTWYERRQDAASEEAYLSFLSRDIQNTLTRLEEEKAFEALQLRDGVVAYRALSSPQQTQDLKAASSAMERLTVRRTLTLQDATYQDLISTGNLRLIKNRELRDRIVDFYEGTRVLFEIINKNNSVFVDDTYNRLMLGLVLPRYTLSNVKSIARVDTVLAEVLRGGYVDEPDRLWSLPEDSPEWAHVKGAVLMRIRVAALAQHFVERPLHETRELKRLVDAELARF